MRFRIALILACLLGTVLAPIARAEQPVVSCVYNSLHTGSVCDTTPLVSSATESSHVFKTTAGVAISLGVNNLSTSSGLTLFLFDAAAVPANGTVTPCSASAANTSCLIKVYGIPVAPSSSQTGTAVINWAPGPVLRFINGFVAACSSTAPPTLTLSSNCWFSAEVLP